MSTSKNYPGQNVLISYLKERGNKSSYHGFLDLHHDIIVTSTFSENWKDLDNSWATHFMEEAEKLNLEALKEKINIERLQRKRNLQIFWQEVIKEYYEKENLVPSITSKVTSTKDFSETSQQKNSELINFCYDILHELENKSCAYPFKYINKADKVIKHPIDLFTINLKLKNNQYKSLKEFEKDVRLIFRNCYTYNNVESEIYHSGEVLESVFNKKWAKRIIQVNKQKGLDLKRARDDADDTDENSSTEYWRKQSRILEQNKNNLVYRQAVDDAFLIASAYESLIAGNVVPFIKILKTFLLTRSQMSLSSADEPVLQVIVENLLPPKYCVPELALVINGKKSKGTGRFGFSDIFVLSKTGNNNVSLELKYISLIGLIGNQRDNFNANDLENLDKILEKEDEESLLNRTYTFWLKENKKTNKITVGEVLNNGISLLKQYMNTISKGKNVNYSSSGVFDKHVKITASNNPNKLKGFVILVVGFRHILWRPVEEVITNYTYNKV
ncbi:uncharacterized protein OCT59_027084 [Rhizophagus irregularis]|uniref:uncharacterized protein n=1 Tax=Rhizophagus irregularis TaxID=588596 RepID=UPI000CC2DC47|nr:hypothetical protein OCT59_027084 [Rhizophagus irregularis]